ncbi:AraC family transcriptional regulator [Halarcobacter anaerophilus]|jgi:AraC-like DNA-binding protein|uniref:AraC family transcriptional regulator n=1 Tax=Halarcobacter anaerophilus TaxID=877500 RepID=A0A4Q0Y3T8_9BACT|nr:AraC family transcriptional regulator [Halarcobacter anaerophilus]QDF29588.1 transcriptional regulator, AraC family [Halarcobacter anaerophilus]RXJ64822.1 AraC family transcriptional regulator [Halarcobacter anaerophilus]
MENLVEKLQKDALDFIETKYTLNINGGLQTEISNLDFYFSDETTEFNAIVYEPSLCIILQGSKAVGFGNELYNYGPKEYLLSSTHVPAKVKVLEASKEKPFVSFRIKFELEDIYDVIKNIDTQKLALDSKSEKGLFFDEINEKLYDPILRLIKLLDKEQEEINYLSSLIIKEILFILINDKSGYFLNKFAMEGTVSNKIVKAISEIKDNFNEKLNVKELAKLIDMSESSLYQNFKTITSMSPIQFQKKIRLEEAKLMLLNQNIEASEVAFAVGYESPSQFSREYSRMFGMSPKAHAEFLKKEIA